MRPGMWYKQKKKKINNKISKVINKYIVIK